MESNLNQLVEDFRRWRSERKSVVEKIPEDLLKRAQLLAKSGQFKKGEICERIQVGHGRIFVKPKDPKFVELSDQFSGGTISVEIRKRDQLVCISMPGNVDIQSLFSALL